MGKATGNKNGFFRPFCYLDKTQANGGGSGELMGWDICGIAKLLGSKVRKNTPAPGGKDGRPLMSKVVIVQISGLILAYLLAVATTVNKVLYSFTKSNYWQYQLLFYLFLLSVSFLVFPVRRTVLQLPRALVLGAVAGYGAALVTFFFLPLLQDGNFHRVWTVRDLSSSFWFSPAVSLSWVVGIYFGVALYVGRRITASR
jgi:hypothetical protein